MIPQIFHFKTTLYFNTAILPDILVTYAGKTWTQYWEDGWFVPWQACFDWTLFTNPKSHAKHTVLLTFLRNVEISVVPFISNQRCVTCVTSYWLLLRRKDKANFTEKRNLLVRDLVLLEHALLIHNPIAKRKVLLISMRNIDISVLHCVFDKLGVSHIPSFCMLPHRKLKVKFAKTVDLFLTKLVWLEHFLLNLNPYTKRTVMLIYFKWHWHFRATFCIQPILRISHPILLFSPSQKT